MKSTFPLCYCVLLCTLLLKGGVVSAWGWSRLKSSNENDNKSAGDGNKSRNDGSATVVNSRSLQSIIEDQERFVLYNSRRLAGECLPICDNPSPTAAPFDETITITGEPTETPKSDFPSGISKFPNSAFPSGLASESSTTEPTDLPTFVPTKTTTGSPTETPTAAPTGKPTRSPTNSPTAYVPANPCDINMCDSCPPGNYRGISDDGSTYCCVGKQKCEERTIMIGNLNICCNGEEACHQTNFISGNPDLFRHATCYGKQACKQTTWEETGPFGICCDGEQACEQLGRENVRKGPTSGSRVQCGQNDCRGSDCKKQVCEQSVFYGDVDVCCSNGEQACKQLCKESGCDCNNEQGQHSWCAETRESRNYFCARN